MIVNNLKKNYFPIIQNNSIEKYLLTSMKLK